MPAHYQLAQINIGRLKYAVDAPEVAEFVNIWTVSTR
jgi:hypothetical protein